MRVVLSWSGGKDSAYALGRLRAQGYAVVGLLTTVTAAYDRVSIHGVRRSLLRWQADAAGLPLYEVVLPVPCPNEVYEERMGEAVMRLVAQGVEAFAFGDLFLEDIRRYREAQLARLRGRPTAPVQPAAEAPGPASAPPSIPAPSRPLALFPLWGESTAELARRMIAEGFRAVVTCVDPRQIDPSFVGREFDEAFLADLPASADPCGEHGEFHTFVYGGPIFEGPPSRPGARSAAEPEAGSAAEPEAGSTSRTLTLVRGEVVERGGFWYCDWQAADSAFSAAGRQPGANTARPPAEGRPR